MTTEKTPNLDASKKVVKKVKLKKGSIAFFVVLLSVISYCTYDYLHKKNIYNSLNIAFTSNKEVEYGENYDPKALIKEISAGSLTNYTKVVDTSKVGTKKLTFEVMKDNIVKKFSVKIKVKDTNAPVINFKENEVSITEGDSYDVRNNLENISDVVDGNIPFSEGEVPGTAYYLTSSNLDSSKAGDYSATIKAVDSNGNVTEQTYTIHVNPKPDPILQNLPAGVVYSNAPTTVDTSSVLGAARSLIGTRYTSGGTTPETGFDCSGFTSYIFGVTGVSISRSSSGQLSNGFAVSESDLQAGDIIIWANDGSDSASHSSVYTGNGTIIHATSNRGVQESSLEAWKTWGQHIIAIRRV